jgi:hypothetical protein
MESKIFLRRGVCREIVGLGGPKGKNGFIEQTRKDTWSRQSSDRRSEREPGQERLKDNSAAGAWIVRQTPDARKGAIGPQSRVDGRGSMWPAPNIPRWTEPLFRP